MNRTNIVLQVLQRDSRKQFHAANFDSRGGIGHQLGCSSNPYKISGIWTNVEGTQGTDNKQKRYLLSNEDLG
jgi:hypothetical protein